MTQRDRDRLVALKKARKGLITQRQAAEEIGQSERHVRRLLDRLKGKGDSALVHALRGRRSNRKLDEKTKEKALVILQRDVYRGFGPTLAAEYWASKHDIHAGRARLAGGSWAETVPDQQDRRRVQPHARAVRAARFDGREHASGVELRGAAWSAGQLLHRQGGSVSNGAENRAVRHRSGSGRARPVASNADRTSPPGIGHRVDRSALAAGQGPRGTKFPDRAGRYGQRPACSRSKDTGAGQRLPGSGVHREVEEHDGRGPSQQRRCAPAFGQGTLAGCFVELCGDQTGRQRLYDSGGSSNLGDRTRRHLCGLAWSRRASRGSARWLHGGAFPPDLPGGEPMSITSPTGHPPRARGPCADA